MTRFIFDAASAHNCSEMVSAVLGGENVRSSWMPTTFECSRVEITESVGWRKAEAGRRAERREVVRRDDALIVLLLDNISGAECC